MHRRPSLPAAPMGQLNLAAMSETYRESYKQKTPTSRRQSIASTFVNLALGNSHEPGVVPSSPSIRQQLADEQIRSAARRVVVDEELWAKFQSSIKEKGAVTGMSLKHQYHELLRDRMMEAGSSSKPPTGGSSTERAVARSMSIHHLPVSRDMPMEISTRSLGRSGSDHYLADRRQASVTAGDGIRPSNQAGSRRTSLSNGLGSDHSRVSQCSNRSEKSDGVGNTQPQLPESRRLSGSSAVDKNCIVVDKHSTRHPEASDASSCSEV